MVNLFAGGTKKNTRIRTHLKHILNVITRKYNSKYLIIQKIANKFPSSVFRLDALVLSVIATATCLAGWVAGWVSVTLRYCIKTAKPI